LRKPTDDVGFVLSEFRAVIEGTGIALDTPEAVAKWISDRKKRWPSKKVVEEKEKAREERVKAGLEAPPRERGARGGRGRGGMDARGRGRGRGAYGGENRGTIRERDDSIKVEEPVKKKVKVEDQGEGSDSGSSSDEGSDEEGGPESIATSKEALKALLGDDASDDDDDEDEEGDEGVEEVSSKPTAATETTESEPTSHKQYQVVCRHWRKGHCALGDAECPYLHTVRSVLALTLTAHSTDFTLGSLSLDSSRSTPPRSKTTSTHSSRDSS